MPDYAVPPAGDLTPHERRRQVAAILEAVHHVRECHGDDRTLWGKLFGQEKNLLPCCILAACRRVVQVTWPRGHERTSGHLGQR
jgi:hypothetical protein